MVTPGPTANRSRYRLRPHVLVLTASFHLHHWTRARAALPNCPHPTAQRPTDCTPHAKPCGTHRPAWPPTAVSNQPLRFAHVLVLPLCGHRLTTHLELPRLLPSQSASAANTILLRDAVALLLTSYPPPPPPQGSLDVTVGQRVVWHVSSVGSHDGLHNFHWHGHVAEVGHVSCVMVQAYR